ncbi:MAG: NPCBM/NEW2 domain-containing protein [Mariniblastus sp.]|nr:NPCBM/NEW2 domain-containing protein [Mariniblastus sp.]
MVIFCFHRWSLCQVLLVMAVSPIFGSIGAACQIGEVTLEMINGKTAEGTLEKIDETGRMTGKGLPPECNIDQVASIKTRIPKNSTAPSGIQIRLAAGGRIDVERLTIGDDEIRIESSGRKEIMPLDIVQAVVWQTTEKTDNQVAARSTEMDTVVVETDSGERLVQGVLEGVDGTHVKIQYRGESRKIAKSKVRALILADLQMPAPEGVMATVRTAQGWVVSGAIKKLEEGYLHLAPLAGSRISVHLRDILSIAVKSDRVVYLSDLEPVDVQQRPEFTVPRSWKRNRSVEGNPLTLKNPSTGETSIYAQGLGTQAFTALTFENGGDFDRFQVTVGIDAETMGHGDCELVVQGDGIQLWSKRVRGSDPPEVLSIDIAGMKEIMLIVKAGEQFDLADHVDWCEARFVKNQ